MDEAIRRDGAWWHRRSDGSWLRYDDSGGTWAPAAAAPPPPPPPPVSISAGPVWAAPSRPVTSEPATTASYDFFASPAPAGVTATPASRAPRRLPIPAGAIAGGILAVAAVAILVAVVAFRGPSVDERIDETFAPLTGYEYQEMPKDFSEGFEQMMSSFPGSDDVFLGLGVRQVTRSGQPVAVALVFALEPDGLNGSNADAFISGFQSTAGVTFSTREIEGHTVYQARSPQGTVLVFLDSEGYVFDVTGPDHASAVDIAAQLIRANL